MTKTKRGEDKMIDIKSEEQGSISNRNMLVGISHLEKDYAIHGHDFFEIELILGGYGESTINGKDVILKPGRINFMTTRDFHDIRNYNPEDRLCIANIRFNQSILNPVILKKIFEGNQTLTFQLNNEETEFMSSVMRVMESMYNDGVMDSVSELALTNMLEVIVIMLLKKTDAFEGERNVISTHIAHAISYLETNFYNDPTLAEVAEYVGLNKNYFSNVFRKETGKTFVQYSNNLKLKYARNLLVASKMTVNEICYKSGFRSVSTFLHEFKKKYGVTPVKYRKQKKQN